KRKEPQSGASTTVWLLYDSTSVSERDSRLKTNIVSVARGSTNRLNDERSSSSYKMPSPGMKTDSKVIVAGVRLIASFMTTFTTLVLVIRQSHLSKHALKNRKMPMNKKARNREFFVRKYTF